MGAACVGPRTHVRRRAVALAAALAALTQIVVTARSGPGGSSNSKEAPGLAFAGLLDYCLARRFDFVLFDPHELSMIEEALAALEGGFTNLPEATRRSDPLAERAVLLETATRLRDNYPYPHPLYVGQMLKPPHRIARAAYALAMTLNPNNHALDGGRASSAMEKEAVAAIARMFGWSDHLGHLCSGGTIANFEALWVTRELAPGRAIAASAQAHYTHARLCKVLGVSFRSVETDERGRMDLDALERVLSAGDVGTVVATLGTTAAGAVDPLAEIVTLSARFGARVHADASYGGYYTLAENLGPDARRAFDQLALADSLVVDPHKHGLQPYGCGCVLFRDPSVGRFYRHDSPYTYFTSDELHLGEISLECSRPGAAAVALWATQRLLPLERGGVFAGDLGACREAALALQGRIAGDPRLVPLFEPELDIVVAAIRAPSATESSRRARRVFEAAAAQHLHLALATFPRPMAEPCAPVDDWDADELLCLRMCAMKPEHREWIPEIVRRLTSALDAAA